MQHVIVLAGGDGQRLADVAEARYGYRRPKQFCDFGDGMTLLDRTLERARAIAPDDRILVVTTAPHRREADECLARWPAVRRLEQPCNRDTLPALTLAVLWVLERDPQARVVVMPSDHAIRDDAAFTHCIHQALADLRHYPFELLLLGARLPEPEDGYGWIVPEGRGAGLPRVAAFREKPAASDLAALLDGGALANTFVMVGEGWSFAEMILRSAPEWFEALVGGLSSPTLLEEAYAGLRASNFSEVVLQRAVGGLRLVPMPVVGWSDIGTPDRLQRALSAPRGSAQPAAPRFGLAAWLVSAGT